MDSIPYAFLKGLNEASTYSALLPESAPIRIKLIHSDWSIESQPGIRKQTMDTDRSANTENGLLENSYLLSRWTRIML